MWPGSGRARCHRVEGEPHLKVGSATTKLDDRAGLLGFSTGLFFNHISTTQANGFLRNFWYNHFTEVVLEIS